MYYLKDSTQHQWHTGKYTFTWLNREETWLVKQLPHWGRATHIHVGNIIIISLDNGLSPVRRQAFIWINAGILLMESLGINISEILVDILVISFKKMRLKMWYAKWQPFCLGLNVFKSMQLHYVSCHVSSVNVINSSPPSTCRIYGSVNRLSIGSDKGLSPIRPQAII